MGRIFNNFDGHDRFDFPEGIERVTSGRGGEALLITCYEKTALIDCGMAYCAEETCENIRKCLNGRKLDYIFVTHSHYDHIGALSTIKAVFDEALTLASEKASYIFSRDGARKVISQLSNDARLLYSDKTEKIEIGDMSVDIILKDNDEINLGGGYIRAYETKGHTDCCMSFLLEPNGVLFASESTGVLENYESIDVAILKSYTDSVKSAETLKACNAQYIIIPHYGIIPQEFNGKYFDLFLKQAGEEKKMIEKWYEEGLSVDEMIGKYKELRWNESREKEQPIEAFMANASAIIKAMK